MSALTRFESVDNFFPEFFRRLARPMEFGAEMPADIRLDVKETDKAYIVAAEVPGARKDDVRVAIDGNVVTISTQTRKDVEDKADGGRVLVRETWRGQSSRTIALAHDVDDKAATAKLEDGMLKLTLPKRTGASSKLLAIQ